MITTFNRIITLAIIVGMIVLTSLFLTQKSFGSAPSGLAGTVATSTLTYAIGTSANVAFATSTCAARIITTTTGAVMLTFTDGQTPTAVTGHLQLASTTVAYDGGQYGCGEVNVISATGATSNISLTDVR